MYPPNRRRLNKCPFKTERDKTNSEVTNICVHLLYL